MKLSLSARIAEQEHKKDSTAISFPDLANLASDTGYSGLCIRPSQVTVKSPDEQVQEMRQVLDRSGMVASMVTLDPIIAENTALAGRVLREIGRHLDIAEMLGADLIRIAIQNDEDVEWTSRACDEAQERGIRLQHQIHSDSPFETVDGSLETIKRIDRPNFGVTVEPGNLVICGQDYGPDSIARLGPHIFNVYVQNVRLSDTGSSSVPTLAGEVKYERLVVGEEGGIDFERFFGGLKAIDYDGFITMHQPSMPDQTPRQLAEFMADRLGRFM